MHRAFTRRQLRQNERFLAALARTGNARLAARELGVNRSTYTKRRAKDPAFAAGWEAALAAADAALQAPPSRLREGARGRGRPPLKTKGGQLHVVRTGGRFQLRRAPPGRITHAAEQAFFAALADSANVRLSAAAAGFAHSSFYARKRTHPAFAREMRVALGVGYDRVQCALMERFLYDEAELTEEEQGWRDHIADNPLPPLTVHDALMLLQHHHRVCRLGWETRDARYTVATNAEVRSALSARLRQMRYEDTGSWLPE